MSLLPRSILYATAGLVAVGLGIGGRVYADRLGAAQNSLTAALNPACTTASECSAVTCGPQTFVVARSVPFDTVEQIRAAWCGTAPVVGIQAGVRCGSLGRCLLGEPTAEVSGAVPTIADLTELDVRKVRVYPNVESAIIEWELSSPADARVTVTPRAGAGITVQSGAGEALRHTVEVRGLLPDEPYTYLVEANFRGRIAARVTGTFRSLAAPPAH